MGLGYRRHRELAELIVAGEVTVDGIVALLEENAAPLAADARPLLINVTGSAVLPSGADLRRIAAAIAAHQGPDHRRVAVHVANPVRFGLARQLGAYLDAAGIELQPFNDRDAAEAWLRPGP